MGLAVQAVPYTAAASRVTCFMSTVIGGIRNRSTAVEFLEKHCIVFFRLHITFHSVHNIEMLSFSHKPPVNLPLILVFIFRFVGFSRQSLNGILDAPNLGAVSMRGIWEMASTTFEIDRVLGVGVRWQDARGGILFSLC